MHLPSVLKSITNITHCNAVFSIIFGGFMSTYIYIFVTIGLGIDSSPLNAFMAANPTLGFFYTLLYVAPFALIGSYVYKNKIRKMILNRGWDEEALIPAVKVLGISFLIFTLIYIAIFFLLYLAR